MAMAQVDIDRFNELPLVDPSVTDGLRAALGSAVDQIIAKSATVLDERVAELGTLEATPLEDRVARLGHEIGGMAAQVGLTRLSKASLTLEATCRDGDSVSSAALIERIAVIAAETKAQVPA